MMLYTIFVTYQILNNKQGHLYLEHKKNQTWNFTVMENVILIDSSHMGTFYKDLVILETVLKREETNPGILTANALKLSGKGKLSMLWA